MNKVFEMKKVSFRYPEAKDKALKDISFSLERGSITVLTGESGCGKTTLLKHMKINQLPFGEGSGELWFLGKNPETMDELTLAKKIGYVGQDPDAQLVTDKVWHELAFSLENIGEKPSVIRQRTGEMAEYFGMNSWFRKSVYELSGGQKQLLNLASVMVMNPELLVLDEPTSQMDPNSAKRFLQTLMQLHQDFGTTIMICEQRLEEVLPLANQVLLMHKGELLEATKPERIHLAINSYTEHLKEELPVKKAMPVSVQLFSKLLCEKESIPCSIDKGRVCLSGYVEEVFGKEDTLQGLPLNRDGCKNECLGKESLTKNIVQRDKKKKPVLQAKHLSFSYLDEKKNEALVLRDFNLSLYEGEIYGILGGNGSGKTTALKILSGIYKPGTGKVKRDKRVVYLAQNPKSVFTEVTVLEELQVMTDHKQQVEEMIDFLQLNHVMSQNPFDLSGGEEERLALGKALLKNPDILLLDEPTKGLDALFKEKLANYLLALKERGVTIVLSSHDLEFCSLIADRVGLLFDGEIISEAATHDFFLANTFYTTAARRLSRNIVEGCSTVEQILEVLTETKGTI